MIVDGADNFPTRYLLNDASLMTRTPLIHASILRFEGHASVFLPYDGPCYRCLFPEPPPPDMAPSCGEAGVLGVLCGVMGNILATEAIKLLLGIGDTLSGRLLIYDALDMTFTELRSAATRTARPAARTRSLEFRDYDAWCAASTGRRRWRPHERGPHPPVLRRPPGGARGPGLGLTVADVLDALYERHPAVRTQLQSPEGELHKFVNVYLNDEDVRLMSWLDTEVADGDTLLILPAMAGGDVDIAQAGLAPPPQAVSPDLVATIGNTPLVELKRISPNPDVRILAKLESHNPTGSIKDRTALSLIEDAERRGAHPAGRHDHGAHLGQHRHLAGHDLPRRAATSSWPSCRRTCTAERRQLLALYGAEIVPTDGEYGLERRGRGRAAARGRERALHALPVRQPGQPARPLRGHRRGDRARLPGDRRLRGRARHGGTLMGLPAPQGAPRRHQGHRGEPLQGDPVSGLRSLDDGFVPPILDLARLDRKLLVSNRDSIVMTRRLADEEGIFAGVSSGAVIHTCARVAEQMTRGTIVGIVCDGGWKYLSAGIWTSDVDDVEETLDNGIFW